MRIATVTLAPALDFSLVVERLVPNEKLHTEQPRLDPGGGGINVARAIRRLGGASVALWACGGAIGQRMAQLLDAEGVEHEAFPIANETRQNVHIEERATGDAFRLDAPGARIMAAEGEALLRRVAALAADYLVLSGALPPGLPSDFYARLARNTRPGTRVILDTSGEALREGLGDRVFLVKPDRHELSALAGRALEKESERVEVARALIGEGKAMVVATELGRNEGLLLVSGAGAERIPVLGIKTISPVGAGDSTVAGIVLGLTRGMSLSEAARFGAAAGAAAVRGPGTELCSREETERIYAALASDAP